MRTRNRGLCKGNFLFSRSKYERLQTQEQDLLRQMFNLQGQSGSLVNSDVSVVDRTFFF